MQGIVASSVKDSRVSIRGPICMLAGMHIGERIKHARTGYRLAKGLEIMTQEVLAEAAGMERGKLSLIEIGKTQNVSEADAKALAAALGISPCWLAVEVGPIEIPQSGDTIRLDVKVLGDILEVVLEVAAQKGWSTTPERLSNFVVKRYQEEAQQGAEINRMEIEKILSYY